MKKARMNISHFRFILSKLKIFGEIVTTYTQLNSAAQQYTLTHAYSFQDFYIKLPN